MNGWTLPVFLRVVKGAPLACLLALRWLQRPAGVLELAELTGIERTTVRRALRTLAAEGIRLVESPGGYGQWRLTAGATQLPLFAPYQLAGSELEEKNLQFCGSSSSLINPLEEVKVKPLLLPRAELEEKNLQFSAECCRLAEALVTRTGGKRAVAQAAVQTALAEHGLTPADVEIEIIQWARYCATAKGINNPGAFVAAKLARNEPAPEVDLGNYSDDYWRVQRLRGAWLGGEYMAEAAEGEDT